MSEREASSYGLAVAWVIIDRTDPELLCEFWSKLLGFGVNSRKGLYVFLQRPSKSGAAIGLQKVAEAKQEKNRVADPEGNEFCALPPAFDMGEEGNVDYLRGVDF